MQWLNLLLPWLRLAWDALTKDSTPAASPEIVTREELDRPFTELGNRLINVLGLAVRGAELRLRADLARVIQAEAAKLHAKFEERIRVAAAEQTPSGEPVLQEADCGHLTAVTATDKQGRKLCPACYCV